MQNNKNETNLNKKKKQNKLQCCKLESFSTFQRKKIHFIKQKQKKIKLNKKKKTEQHKNKTSN